MKKRIIKDMSNNNIHNIKNLNVLLVDDDEISMYLLKILLKASNKIFTANTGAEAVKMCKDIPDIDLILIDMMMPIMGGSEATQAIRKFNTDVVIIAQTARGLAGDREMILESGCNDYLVKPINKNVLISKIHECFKN
jgi:CheY-like chemotaxis protein